MNLTEEDVARKGNDVVMQSAVCPAIKHKKKNTIEINPVYVDIHHLFNCFFDFEPLLMVIVNGF